MAKGGLALLIGSPKKMGGKPPMGSSDDDGDEPDDMGSGAEERAIQDFFEAGKRGDYKAATAAFRRAYDACSTGGGESDSDGDEEA